MIFMINVRFQDGSITGNGLPQVRRFGDTVRESTTKGFGHVRRRNYAGYIGNSRILTIEESSK